MSQLSQAIFENDSDAPEMAARMGKAALSELAKLMEHEDSAIRMRTVKALGAMELSLSYEVLFSALDDDDINVINAAVHQIEKHESSLSTEILIGVLDKLVLPEAKNRVVLLLGNRLNVTNVQPLDKYCTTEHPEILALHCMAAMAKIGVEQRRKQFSTYLQSIKDDNTAFLEMFDLIEYIDQPWIVPSLRALLNNKHEVQFLGDAAKLMGLPSHLRVCDKAVQLIASLLDVKFPFDTVIATNYTDQQLAQADRIASEYQY